MSERAIETRLVRQVRAMGGEAFKWSSPSTRAVPDRLVIIHGHILGVEVKREGCVPRADQRVMHRRLRMQGMRVEVVDSVASVDRLCRELGEKIGVLEHT